MHAACVVASFISLLLITYIGNNNNNNNNNKKKDFHGYLSTSGMT